MSLRPLHDRVIAHTQSSVGMHSFVEKLIYDDA